MNHIAGPSIRQSVSGGYQDAFRAIAAMPLLAVCAFTIGFVDAVLGTFFFRNENGETHLSLMLTASMLWSLLYTPILIAVHRFVLLDIVTNQYRIDGSARFLRFFAWSLYVNALYVLSFSLFGLFAETSTLAMLAGIVVLLIAIYFTLRLVTLFPAIAIDATHRSWCDAYRSTKGYAPRILATFVVAVSPVIAIHMAVELLRDADTLEAEINPFNVSVAVMDGAIFGLLAITCVAIASRFYEWMGDRSEAKLAGA